MRTLPAQPRGVWSYAPPGNCAIFRPFELNSDGFHFGGKKYYSQAVRGLADQAHVHISRADG